MNSLRSSATSFALQARKAIQDGDQITISNEELEAVLTAAVKLYAARAELTRHFPSPLTEKDVTPTEVVIVASEMIRVVNINPFDLSMWYGRAQ